MNYFKFLRRLRIGAVAIIALLTSTVFVACSDSQQPDEPEGIISGYNVIGYYFDGFSHHYHPDSIVSADAHELTFYTKVSRAPYHWDKAETYISLWDYEEIEGYGIKGGNAGAWKTCDFTRDGNTISYDWISVELVIEGDEYWANVSVKPNDTGKERCAQFEIIEDPYAGVTWCTYLIVTQKPVIDDTPFEIKARYKENIYSTQAHLDNLENLVFENAEFSEMMTMLQNRDDIECVILEDGIVDYFDKNDMKSTPILNAITTPISTGDTPEVTRSVCPNHLENLHNGYRFMTLGAAGYFGLFEGVNFEDNCLAKNALSKYTVFELCNTEPMKMENNISSIALAYEATDTDVCAVLTLSDQRSYNYGYTPHRMFMIATPSNPHVWCSDLKKVPCLNTSKSWNDRICAYSFHFGVLGTSNQ